MERMKTKNSEVWVESEILMIKMSGDVNSGSIIEIADAGLDFTRKFKNIKYIIVDISGVRNAPLSARKTAFEKFSTPAEKMAFVCANPVARIIGSFFLRRYKLSIPTKMFSDVEDARKWLKDKI